MTDRDRTGRLFVVLGLGITALAVVVALLLVRFDRGPTPTADLIGGLHRQLLVVAIPISILVEVVLGYTIWRFRRNEDRKSTPKRRGLELGWTLATAVVLLFVGVASYQVMAHPAVGGPSDPVPEDEAVTIEVTAHQWDWSVAYTGENVTVVQADRFVLPADRPIRIRLTSTDVIHSFHAPRLGLKQDAIPGRHGVLWTEIDRTGEYRLYCAEYCGAGHADMDATIAVVPNASYQSWLDARRNGTTAG